MTHLVDISLSRDRDMFSCSNSRRFISSGDQDMQYGSTNGLNDLTVYGRVSGRRGRGKKLFRVSAMPLTFTSQPVPSRARLCSASSQAGDVPQAPKVHSPRGIDTSGNRRCARANRTPTVLDESPFFFFSNTFPR